MQERPVYSRDVWMGVLAKARLRDIESHWRSLSHPAFVWIRRPEFGVVMARGRASGTGAQFNFGEVTITRCSLRIETGEIGVGYVLGRSKRHAGLAALFDAMMLREAPAAESDVGLCIDALAQAEAARRYALMKEAQTSKVDFFMMSPSGEG